MKNLPTHIYTTLVSNGAVHPSELPHMSAAEIIDAWLSWNGIIRYTDQIIEVVEAAYAYTETPLHQPERERLVAKTLELTANALQTAVDANHGAMPDEFALSIEPRAVIEHLERLEADAAQWRAFQNSVTAEHFRHSTPHASTPHVKLGDES